jgi:hypothetical protein
MDPKISIAGVIPYLEVLDILDEHLSSCGTAFDTSPPGVI